jgi:hypothetical protein
MRMAPNQTARIEKTPDQTARIEKARRFPRADLKPESPSLIMPGLLVSALLPQAFLRRRRATRLAMPAPNRGRAAGTGTGLYSTSTALP